MTEIKVLDVSKQQEPATPLRDKVNIPLAIRPDDGKQCLPEGDPEFEPEDIEEYEADVEAEEDEQKEIAFSEKDTKDFDSLEEQLFAGKRQVAEAYRLIRNRQLWRLRQNEQGSQLYSTFDEYCESHGHTRQWVTHLTNWLRITEEFECLGIKEHLSVRAAQGLLIGRLDDAGGLRTVLEEAKKDGVPLDRDHLRAIVLRRADYNFLSKNGEEGVNKPAATTYAKYKDDLATSKKLGDAPTDYTIVAKAKELEGDFSDNLVSLCQQERKLPRANDLVVMLTDKPLENIVGRLMEVAEEAAEIEEKKQLHAARRKQIKEMQEEGGLRKLKEEEKALRQMLEAKGVLKKKGSTSEEPPLQVVSEDEDDADKEPSGVRNLLTEAKETLAQALSAEWPDVDHAELNRILLVAQDCETTVATIISRVDDLLDTDAEEPEAVPNGDD